MGGGELIYWGFPPKDFPLLLPLCFSLLMVTAKCIVLPPSPQSPHVYLHQGADGRWSGLPLAPEEFPYDTPLHPKVEQVCILRSQNELPVFAMRQSSSHIYFKDVI